MIKQLVMAVSQFHRHRIGRSPKSQVGWPEDRVLLQRMAHLQEELGEIATGVNVRDMAKVADGLGDLAYVIVGTALDLGIDLDAVLGQIHASNMSKDPIDPVSGKGGKGKNFFPPDLGDLTKIGATNHAAM